MTELTIVEVKPRRKYPAKRIKRPKVKRKYKISTWTLKKADRVFSAQIVARDGKCLHPDSKHGGALQCSHYIGRATKSTRYDPDNCITLCWWHHYGSKLIGWEYQKQNKLAHGFDGQYTLFMKEWLGKERWELLNLRSLIQVKQAQAIKDFVASL